MEKTCEERIAEITQGFEACRNAFTAIGDETRQLILLVLLILGSTGLPRKAAALAGGKLRAHPAVFTAVELGLILAGFVLCVAFLVDASYNPFLYFRF